MNIDLLLNYFPNLTAEQKERFAALDGLYRDWNAKINVISRQDIDALYEKHILHSLGIAKIVSFKPGTEILDVGTGGGFPGIPLAILFPMVDFNLVDSIGKKIKVVQEVTDALGQETRYYYDLAGRRVGEVEPGIDEDEPRRLGRSERREVGGGDQRGEGRHGRMILW